jgi:hypothetical protein
MSHAVYGKFNYIVKCRVYEDCVVQLKLARSFANFSLLYALSSLENKRFRAE